MSGGRKGHAIIICCLVLFVFIENNKKVVTPPQMKRDCETFLRGGHNRSVFPIQNIRGRESVLLEVLSYVRVNRNPGNVAYMPHSKKFT